MDNGKTIRWPFVVLLLVIIVAGYMAVTAEKQPEPDKSVRPSAAQKADFIRSAQFYFCDTIEQVAQKGSAFSKCVDERFGMDRHAAVCRFATDTQQQKDACFAAPKVWVGAFVTYSRLDEEWVGLCEYYPAKDVVEFLHGLYIERELNERIEVGLTVPDGLPERLPSPIRWDGVHEEKSCPSPLT